MIRLAVFAYGSLVSASSASETLNRWVEPLPATLNDHRRGWTVARDNARSEKSFELADGGSRPDWVLGLNLEPRPGSSCNGAVIEIDEFELDRLGRRELRYAPAEIDPGLVVGAGALSDLRCVAFYARPEHHRPEPPPRSVIAAAYARTVEAAFDALGADQLAAYRNSTDLPPAPVADLRLIGGSIPPGNPRDW